MQLSIQHFSGHTYIHAAWLRRTRGNNEERTEDYWKETLPCQSLDWRDSSLSSRGSRSHLPLNTEWCSPGFSNADCTSIIWWSAQEPGVSTQRAEQREEVGRQRAAPRHSPPLLSNFQEVISTFSKTCRFEVLNGKHHFPHMNPFRNILKMEYIFIWSSPNRSQAVYVH